MFKPQQDVIIKDGGKKRTGKVLAAGGGNVTVQVNGEPIPGLGKLFCLNSKQARELLVAVEA